MSVDIKVNFTCGHPRSPENSTLGYLHKNGNRYPQCRLCSRVRSILEKVERGQKRINAGLPLRGTGAALDWL